MNNIIKYQKNFNPKFLNNFFININYYDNNKYYQFINYGCVYLYNILLYYIKYRFNCNLYNLYDINKIKNIMKTFNSECYNYYKQIKFLYDLYNKYKNININNYNYNNLNTLALIVYQKINYYYNYIFNK